MSLTPWMFRCPVTHAGPASLFAQNFGLDDELFSPRENALSMLEGGYLRPWRRVLRQTGTSDVVLDKNGLKVNLDVQHFRPEEITVKVVDNFVIVDGNQEERSDEHGFFSRCFKRSYAIPETIEADAVTSSLSPEGVLTITAPPKAIAQSEVRERVIPIVRTVARAVFTGAAASPGAPASASAAVSTGAAASPGAPASASAAVSTGAAASPGAPASASAAVSAEAAISAAAVSAEAATSAATSAAASAGAATNAAVSAAAAASSAVSAGVKAVFTGASTTSTAGGVQSTTVTAGVVKPPAVAAGGMKSATTGGMKSATAGGVKALFSMTGEPKGPM